MDSGVYNIRLARWQKLIYEANTSVDCQSILIDNQHEAGALEKDLCIQGDIMTENETSKVDVGDTRQASIEKDSNKLN